MEDEASNLELIVLTSDRNIPEYFSRQMQPLNFSRIFTEKLTQKKHEKYNTSICSCSFCMFRYNHKETETRSLSDFTSVSSSQSIRVTLKKGNEPKVDVSTTGELEDVITDVKDGNLKIEMESNKNV